MIRLRKHSRPLKFILVGIINTVTDICIYWSLTHAGVNFLVANIISTSCGMLVSFTLNRIFTFRTTSKDVPRQLSKFLGVTLFGLWVIQPPVIFVFSKILKHNAFGFIPAGLVIFAPKLIATGVSLIWNYVLYNKVVFKIESSQDTHTTPT